MTLVETKAVQIGIGDSLNASFQYLERMFEQEDNLQLKLQIVADLLILFQDAQTELNVEANEKQQTFKDLRNQIKPIKDSISNFLEKYPNCFEAESQEKIENLKNFFNLLDSLLEGFQIINESENYQNDIIFLIKLYKGLDMVVTLAENNGNLFPIYLKSFLRVFLIGLPAKIREKLTKIETDQKIEVEFEKYSKKINRASISGIWHLDFWAKERQKEFIKNSEESILRKQIEKNKIPLNYGGAKLREDQLRTLTTGQKEEKELLMQMIDEQRERQLFSKK